jgi:hypothetical protein
MSGALRHRCRNPRCRLKLPAPVENHHCAFCTRGCFESFYQNRCRVCERDLRKTGRRGDAGRLYCRPPARCRQEAEKWPEKYRYGPPAAFPATKLRSAHSTGIKFGLAGYPPVHNSLRHWWWADPGIGDLSLYDSDGLTLARIVLKDDGCYHLRTPITWPRMAWAGLDAAKHRAESLALSAIPLESFDPKLAARIKKDNATPHPMGPPLNRQPHRTDGEMLLGANSKITETKTDSGINTSIPDFLRRTP